MNIQLNSKDLLAKLLATENLTVLRAPVRTACFDVESRTLTLPQWKEMSPEVEEMLIGHEVGHALFTTNEYIKAETYTRSFHGYMNVCEDVRIEKKIKNKYPGLRRTFIQGYKELNEKDFFDIAGKDLTKILLIDKINLYFKCGINCGVRFTPAEMDLVRKVERTDTMADVYDIANEIYTYEKGERKKRRQEMREARKLLNLDAEDAKEEQEELEEMLNQEYDDEPLDDDELDDYDEGDSAEESSDSDPKEEPSVTPPTSAGDPWHDKEDADKKDPEPEITEDDEIKSHTDDAFYRRVEEYADTDTEVHIYEPKIFDNIYADTVIGYKRVIAELTAGRVQRDIRYYTSTEGVFDKASQAKQHARHNSNVEKYKSENSRVVNYLVKEFEMRKSATQYKRTQTAKIGQLNTSKLAVYQLTDDLFRRIQIVPDAKNHGMMFLLDWSGSMMECIEDTLKQVISLATFCQRAMIPYQVFAFSNDYETSSRKDRKFFSREEIKEMGAGRQFIACGGFNLIELFSNKMTTSEFNQQVSLMLDAPWHLDKNYGLGATPLNEALLYMIETQISKFMRANNVEKFSFITLTDGQGQGLQTADREHLYDSRYDYDTHKNIKVKNYMRDPITHREYALTRHNNTSVLLQIIKDRYNCSVVGFHVLRNSKRNVQQFLDDNVFSGSDPSHYAKRHVMMDEIRVGLRKEGFYSVTDTSHDELFLISQTKLSIDEGELEVKDNMNSKAIAKQFEKYMNVKKTSRILLNRFVGLVA